jgi:hypothetical protein
MKVIFLDIDGGLNCKKTPPIRAAFPTWSIDGY